mmetsp:Transcript_42343/g.130697  ORF Transcript_42343/g.130697 Transcript_42343/m.130697 type:complete len:227 (-) Transcript_42343:329-1009(-)
MATCGNVSRRHLRECGALSSIRKGLTNGGLTPRSAKRRLARVGVSSASSTPATYLSASLKPASFPRRGRQDCSGAAALLLRPSGWWLCWTTWLAATNPQADVRQTAGRPSPQTRSKQHTSPASHCLVFHRQRRRDEPSRLRRRNAQASWTQRSSASARPRRASARHRAHAHSRRHGARQRHHAPAPALEAPRSKRSPAHNYRRLRLSTPSAAGSCGSWNASWLATN